MRALSKDGWTLEGTRGSVHSYRKERRVVAIHFHSGKTYGSKMLKNLLESIGWNDSDFKRLKLIK